MSSLSRRSFLAGGVAAAGAVGGGLLLPPSLLPEPVANWRTRRRSVPAVAVEPPVSEAHEREAVAALRDLVGRAEREWARAEGAGADPPSNTVGPETTLRSARGYLDDAEQAAGREALVDVRRGAMYAGETVGSARLALGETSGEEMADRARAILAAADEEADRVVYEFVEPSVGLARLFWVQKWLRLARLNAYRDGTYTGRDEPTTRYDDHSVVTTWGSHAEARRYRHDAARLYDDYRDGLGAGEDRLDLTEHVHSADERLYDDATDRAFSRDEVRERRADAEALPEGPYRTFRGFLTYYVGSVDIRSPDGLEVGLPVYRAVSNAGAILRTRAYETVVADERLSDDDARVTDSVLYGTKRDALSLLERRREEAGDRPLFELLLREGRSLLRAGDARLRRGGDVDYPRARAYANYHLAVGTLEHVEEMAAIIDRPADGR